MKANELLKYITLASPALNQNALVPIAKNFLFKGSEIIATDFSISMVVKTPYTFDNSVAVDGQKIVALLKSLKNEEIDITLASPTTTIKSSSGVYQISAYKGDEFPQVEIEKGENVCKGYHFQKALELTENCVSTDALRPIMTGVYFDSELGAVVATNGHKLAKLDARFKESFVLPAIASGLFKSISDEDVYYKAEGNAIHFISESIAFKVTKLEGKYPPYDRVIPPMSHNTLAVDQSALQTALKRVSLFSSSETSLVSLELGDVIKIKAIDVNYGNSADETLQGTYMGEDMVIGLNSRFLMELLQTSGEGVLSLNFSGPTKPVLISNSETPKYLQLVMPIAL